MQQIELFCKSITKTKNMELTRNIWAAYVATQGGYKDIVRYTDKLQNKQYGIEELLRDYGRKHN